MTPRALFRLPRLLTLHLVGMLASVLALYAPPTAAQGAGQLRVASAFDPQTMDPHAVALLYHSRVVFQVYESLVGRDERFQLEPGLALSRQQHTPTSWRFRLRNGVIFHDGTPFTADDAVFSFERALTAPSQRAFQLKGVSGVKKLDSHLIEIQLEAQTPCCPKSCSTWP